MASADHRKSGEIPVLDDSADYSTWKKEVNIWVLGTSAKPTQQASKLIMSMRGKPRDVAINLSPEEIGAEDGLKNLFKELDKLYNKDSTQSLFKAIDEFESYRRPGEADIDKYILEFQRRYKCLKQLRENKDLYEDTILEIYWNSSQGNHNNRPSLRFGAQQDRGRSQGSNFRYRPYGRENHYSNRGNNSNQRGQ